MKVITVEKNMDQKGYCMAAVLYLLSGEKANIKVAEHNEIATYDIPEYREKIRNAVPGYNSNMMYLLIKSNVSEPVINDNSKDIDEKIQLIAGNIRQFVII